ncbi:MAG: preprotein translocase subunit SecE [Myxococcota bacterium]
MLFIVGAVLLGVFLRSLVAAVMGYAVLEDPIVGGVLPLSTLLGVVGGIAGFFVGLRVEKAVTFVDSVVSELKKVSWPSREETTSNTTIVLGASVFFASLLAVYDFAWAKVTGLFLFTGG